MRELRIRIAPACCRVRWNRPFDLGQLIMRESQRQRSQSLAQAVPAARANERNDRGSLGGGASHDPCDGHLGDRSTHRAGNRTELLDQSQIGIQIRALKARRPGAKVTLLTVLLPVPTDQAPREHAVSGDTDPQFTAGRKDLAFYPT